MHTVCFYFAFVIAFAHLFVANENDCFPSNVTCCLPHNYVRYHFTNLELGVRVDNFDLYSALISNPDYANQLKMDVHRPIMRISNDESEGFTGTGTAGWHIDGAYQEKPFSFLLFQSVIAPKEGDTEFAGQSEVLNNLSDADYKMLDNLYIENIRIVKDEPVKVIHPLIYSHPITRTKSRHPKLVDYYSTNMICEYVSFSAKLSDFQVVMCLHVGFMNRTVHNYQTSAERLGTVGESERVKDIITDTIRDNDLMYSHKWEKDDLIIVDNLAVLHHASSESQFSPKDVGLRVLHRVVVLGESVPKK